MNNDTLNNFYKRIETEIQNYLTQKVELSEGVFFNQYDTIKRIYKFRNRDLGDGKLNADLSYNYYFDIISNRVDSEVKNLRFDTKHILIFSRNPRKDFPAVFLANASLKEWMAENGEDEKLKDAVEEFVANGNIIFKRVSGGYQTCDSLNTYITNIMAKSVNNTDIVERHVMTASELKRMEVWDQKEVDRAIRDLGDKSFSSTTMTTPASSTSNKYEIYEFTGEVSEQEYNAANNMSEEGDPHKYFLAKVVFAGLKDNHQGTRYILFSEKLKGKMSDWYISAHRGSYTGRFWRIGMYELLIDHQIRANEIGNDLARALEWSSKAIFRSKDSKVLQNIRADLDNGDVIIAEDLQQINLRAQGMDQHIGDWNRLMTDADRLANSYEVVRGETPPSGTPFRSVLLSDQNAGKMFVFFRQKLTLPFKRVFREWVLPELVKDLEGRKIFELVGDENIVEQLREILVDSWYIQNLVAIGPHTREVAEALKEEKMEEIKKIDPIIENADEIWKDVKRRLFVTITGENSDIADNVQDLVNIINLEEDPNRRAWILDMLYKIRGIPVPPKPKEPLQAKAQGMAEAPQLPVPEQQPSRPEEAAQEPPLE